MYIVAVDPGKMCGMFAAHESGNIVGCLEAPPFETINWVESFVRLHESATLLVIERFSIGPETTKMTRQYDALETIGALKYVAAKLRVSVRMQARGDRIKVTNATLKQIGWYSATAGGHVNDAARHCFVTFAVRFPDHDLVKKTLDMI
jgi:hypothetical protein